MGVSRAALRSGLSVGALQTGLKQQDIRLIRLPHRANQLKTLAQHLLLVA